jgi:hypothetical protein
MGKVILIFSDAGFRNIGTLLFGAGSPYVAQASFEFWILLPISAMTFLKVLYLNDLYMHIARCP